MEEEKLTLSLETLDVEINEASTNYEELNQPYKCPFCYFSAKNFVNMITLVIELRSETKEVKFFNSSNSKCCAYLCYYCEKKT